MSFFQQFAGLVQDAQASLDLFRPELALIVTIVAMLLVRCLLGRRSNAFYVALAGSLVALAYAAPWSHLDGMKRTEIFTGLLVYDGFGLFIRSIVLLFLVLFVLFTRLSGVPDREDSQDVYSLVFGAALGMCLMASANHLFMVFVAVEMASVPSYALAGLLKGRRKSSEAALKYAIFGAGTAGVMLYGISLLVGICNTAHLPSLAAALAEKVQSPGDYSELAVLVLGALMLSVGLAFKLSAVPFHFWCPDVFEGAPAEVNAFLSVASKAAALAIVVRVAVGAGAIPSGYPASIQDKPQPSAAMATVEPDSDASVQHPPRPAITFVAATEPLSPPALLAAGDAAPISARPADRNTVLQPVRQFAAMLIALIACITCTFGNLAAYGQTNIKRLLAYSTIAHAGYMLMAVPAALMLASRDNNNAAAERAIAALGIYLAVYLFLNLGAFAIVAFLRNALHSEEIAAYSGLIRRSPLITISMALILFGLVGLPPLSGFVGKFAIFASLTEAWQVTGARFLLVTLLVGGLNTAVSLYYYLRVAKVMTIDAEPADRSPREFSDVSLQGAFVWLLAAPTLVLFVFWQFLNDWLHAATRGMFG